MSGRGGGYGDVVYNRNNPPVMPTYLAADSQSKWLNRTQFSSLAGYCMELGLVQVGRGWGFGVWAPGGPGMYNRDVAELWALLSTL